MSNLFNDIRQLLWFEWDPIGVNDNHLLKDEYDSYAMKVYRMLIEGRDHYAISEYLERIALRDIGVSQSTNHDAIAARAIELFESKI